jgi:glutamine amidotransferase
VCRHLAHLGPSVVLRDLLFDAPHSLCEQAHHPRHQSKGRVNKDGWGVGWYATDGRVAGYYRTTTSMWDDDDFRAADCTSRAFLAAARLASPGATLDATGNAPFRADPWLFSLNGYVKEFHDGIGDELRSTLTERRRAAIEGDADSEVVFALVLDHIDAGVTPQAALRAVIERVTSLTDAKLNLVLTDGRVVHATRFGNSLFMKDTAVASEPLDDDDEWSAVPDCSIVLVAADNGSRKLRVEGL